MSRSRTRTHGTSSTSTCCSTSRATSCATVCTARSSSPRSAPRTEVTTRGIGAEVVVDDVVATRQTAVVATSVASAEGQRAEPRDAREARDGLARRRVLDPHHVNDVNRLPALLLTGGASRRMGTDKATIEFRGETLAARAARVLAEVCDPVIEVGTGVTRLPVGARSTRRARDRSPRSSRGSTRCAPSVPCSCSRATCRSSRLRCSSS